MSNPSAVDATDPVRSIAVWDPERVSSGDTVEQLAQALVDANCGSMLVETIDGALAIVTERDVLRAVAAGTSGSDWVTDVMTREVLSVPAGERICDAADLMLGASIRHVIVQDEDTERVGLVSMRDLIEPLLNTATGRG